MSFVYLNGQLIQQVASAPTPTQCILAGAALQMGMAPFAEDDLFVFIQTNLGSGLVQVLLTGTQDEVNTSFELATAPPAGSSVMFYVNGLALNQVASAPTPSQMTVSGLTCAMGFAPAAGDFLIAYIEQVISFVFLHALPMTGAATQWTTPINTIPGFSPLLIVFVNGQLQQEVSTAPIVTQFRQTATNTVLTVTLGISLTSGDDLQVYIAGLVASDAVIVAAPPSLPLYLDMQNELLVLMNERIDHEEAKMCLNRRWQKILNAWSWSFVKTNGVITTKAPKTAGTVAVTQDSFFVVGTNTSFAVTDVGAYLVLGDQPYLVVDVQVGSATQQLLRINSTYPGVTNAALPYQLYYKDYALDSDVVDVLSMAGPHWSFDEIAQVSMDEVDANRSYVGQPYSYIQRGMGTNGIYQVELWPVPNARYTIHYVGVLRSALTNKGQIIPDISEVLLMAAEGMACGIVSSKCAADKDYEGAAFWAAKGAAKRTDYLDSLTELKSKDRRKFGRDRSDGGISGSASLVYGWGERRYL